MSVQDFVNWCNSQIGQHDDYDHAYGTQCVDFFNFAYQYLTGHNPLADFGGLPGAKDIWPVATPYFTRIVNDPTNPNQLPPQGSILFWGGEMPGSGGFGHVAIVDHADAVNIVVWEEVPGSNVQHITRRWSNPSQHWELGWWMFNGFQDPTPEPAPEPAPVAQPQPTPPPAPRPLPSAPLTASSSDPYLVVRNIPGYLSSNQAANRMGSNSTVSAGTYTIFNKRFDTSNPPRLLALNVTNVPGKPGWWINPADNVMAPIAPPAVTTYVGPRQTSVAAPPALPVEPNWRSTYRAFTNKDGIRVPVKYVALGNYVVKDLATQKADAALHAGQEVTIAGTFIKDGVVYGRPLAAVQDSQGTLRGWWYGIPLDGTIIEEYAKVYSIQTSISDRQLLDTMTLYDHFVIAFESIRRALAPAFAIFTNKDRQQ